jgi:hypothetical protein
MLNVQNSLTVRHLINIHEGFDWSFWSQGLTAVIKFLHCHGLLFFIYFLRI